MNKLRPVYLIDPDLSCGVIHFCDSQTFLFDLDDRDKIINSKKRFIFATDMKTKPYFNKRNKFKHIPFIL